MIPGTGRAPLLTHYALRTTHYAPRPASSHRQILQLELRLALLRSRRDLPDQLRGFAHRLAVFVPAVDVDQAVVGAPAVRGAAAERAGVQLPALVVQHAQAVLH